MSIEIRDFTPCLDELVTKYGLSIAAVYGKVYRYSQMEEEECFAGQERIGEELALSRGTINRHLQLLEREGYLRKVRTGRTNHYVTTEKAGIFIGGYANSAQQMYDNRTTDVQKAHTKKEVKKEPKTPLYREYREAFTKATGIPPLWSNHWARKTDWDQPLLVIAEFAKVKNLPILDFMTRAAARMRDRGMRVSAPKSLVSECADMVGRSAKDQEDTVRRLNS